MAPTTRRDELDPQQIELRESREQAGMTREKLSGLLGRSVRTIARWENDPGRLEEDSFHKAMSAIRSRTIEIEVRDNAEPLNLSEIPSVELARELTRRLEQVEDMRREFQTKLEMETHFPSY